MIFIYFLSIIASILLTIYILLSFILSIDQLAQFTSTCIDAKNFSFSSASSYILRNFPSSLSTSIDETI